MASDAKTIVPANRLGQLLVEARHREGLDLEELATVGGFTVGELADFEAGHRVLNDEVIAEVTSLYSLDAGPIVPQRAELTLDLNDNLLIASGHAVPLHSDAHSHVLDRYLSLVYVLRDRNPGSRVPLRGEDIDILAASLAERRELIEEQLLISMAAEEDSVSGLVGWFKRRLWVPGAGALVGAVSIGTLVLVTGSSDAPSETIDQPEPEPRPEGFNNFAAPVIGAGSPQNTTSTVEAPTTSELALARSSDASNTPTSTSVPQRETESEAAPRALAAENRPVLLGAQAEALLPFDWQQILPDWEINYLDEDSRFRGLTYPYDKSIDMFVRDSDTPESLAGILAHEIAHAIDVEHFDDGDRNQWREARNLGSTQWWPDAYASDFQTGAGDFAESFAYWALGDETSSQLGGNPDAAQLAVIGSLFSQISV